jgi:hypothetical protein
LPPSVRRACVQALRGDPAASAGAAPGPPRRPRARGEETGLPDGADRELVLRALAVGPHVFLTRDQLVLDRVAFSGTAMEFRAWRNLVFCLGSSAIQSWRGCTLRDADA